MIPVLDDAGFIAGAGIGVILALYWFLRYRIDWESILEQ